MKIENCLQYFEYIENNFFLNSIFEQYIYSHKKIKEIKDNEIYLIKKNLLLIKDNFFTQLNI